MVIYTTKGFRDTDCTQIYCTTTVNESINNTPNCINGNMVVCLYTVHVRTRLFMIELGEYVASRRRIRLQRKRELDVEKTH
jgi:hypothetical protein